MSTDGGAAVAQLEVRGMHCGSCAALIEETLTDRSGVRSATVDLATERARIVFDPSELDVPAICAAIAEVGYGAVPVTESGSAD